MTMAQITRSSKIKGKPSPSATGRAAPFDEMRLPEGGVRAVYQAFAEWQRTVAPKELERKRKEAELLFRRLGITFLVYGKDSSSERLIPFDVIPRIIAAEEWKIIQAGCYQRVRAINAFLHDIYHGQEIIRASMYWSKLKGSL